MTPVAEITLKEVYDLVLDVRRTLDQKQSDGERIDDHESRIRVLEKWVWGASGIAAAVGTFAGAIVGKLIP